MPDDNTLAFYALEANTYASRTRNEPEELAQFLSLVPARGKILELGCGGGHDTAVMLSQGFSVAPTDGSPEMAREAERRLGMPVEVLLFSDLSAHAAYDGVWASACLLHVPLAELESVLRKIRTALVPGGWFYASYKAGTAPGRDALGRYYSYPDAQQLSAIYESTADWASIEIAERDGGGYDGQPTRWLSVLARS